MAKRKNILLASFEDMGGGDGDGMSMKSFLADLRKKATKEPPTCAILDEASTIDATDPW